MQAAFPAVWLGRAARKLAAAGLTLGVAGCAAIPWPAATVPRSARTPVAAGWIDLRGAVHVHTRASHDSPGSTGELIRGAAAAGLDWIALTEHTRPGELPPSEGLVEGVRLIPGFELSLAGGSLLALGLREADARVRGPARSGDVTGLISELHRRGAIAALGHVESIEAAALTELRAAPLDAVEIVNLHAAARRRPARLAAGQLLLPAGLGLRALAHVDPETKARWVDLGRPGGVVAGADAHAKIRVLGPLGGTMDRYADLFRLVTTHVLATDDSERAILDAIRAGRSYVAFESLARVERFEVELGADGVTVRTPAPARLELHCDGERVAVQTAAAATLAVPAHARLCHVEAWLGSRPWIIGSALRVGPVAATASRRAAGVRGPEPVSVPASQPVSELGARDRGARDLEARELEAREPGANAGPPPPEQADCSSLRISGAQQACFGA